MKNDIKCKYCGRIYSSPSEMRKRKCHSHPKGAWCGYCTPDILEEGHWKTMRFFDAQMRYLDELAREAKEAKAAEVKCCDFAKKLQEAYKKNFAPFRCVFRKDQGSTLVFYMLHIGRGFANMEVVVLPEAVKVTIYAHHGTLEDIQAFANKNAQLKKLFPEIVARRLQHSKIAYADVPAFINKVLVALRSPTPQKAPKASPKAEGVKTNKCSDFVKKLLDTNSKNYAPFKKLWIYKGNTLVFDEYSVEGKKIAVDVAALPDEKVNVTLLMRNGNLNDVQAFAAKNAQLKPLFTETVAQRLLRSKIAYADVLAFINKVLVALRSPTLQKVPKASPKAEGVKTNKCCDFAKKLLDTYSKNYAPFKKLWIYKGNTLVFDEYSVEGKKIAVDVVALPDEKVNVTLLMRNGNLNDVQAFAVKNAQLKPLFTETVAQRLLHSKIAYADVPAFINKVLAALRSPTHQQAHRRRG